MVHDETGSMSLEEFAEQVKARLQGGVTTHVRVGHERAAWQAIDFNVPFRRAAVVLWIHKVTGAHECWDRIKQRLLCDGQGTCLTIQFAREIAWKIQGVLAEHT